MDVDALNAQTLEGGHSMTLTSPSGVLKHVSPSAAYDEEIALLRSHPESRRYLQFFPPVTTEEVRKRRESRAKNDTIIDFYVMLCNVEPPKLVGITGLFNIDRLNDTCSVGILIHPEYFRGGLATQTLYTLMKFAFEDEQQHIYRAVFETGVDNVMMKGWLENVTGVQMEFRWRDAWKAGPGKRVDVVGYSILEHEWREKVREKLESRISRA